MPSVVSVVIDSGTFATVIGVSFTATLALLAYIVRTLAAVDGRVAVQSARIDALEKRETYRNGPPRSIEKWAGESGMTRPRILMIVVAFMTILILFWSALVLNVQYQDARVHDSCVQRRNLYDGQIAYTRFLAHELKATKEQTAQGIRDFREAAGPRPSCG